MSVRQTSPTKSGAFRQDDRRPDAAYQNRRAAEETITMDCKVRRSQTPCTVDRPGRCEECFTVEYPQNPHCPPPFPHLHDHVAEPSDKMHQHRHNVKRNKSREREDCRTVIKEPSQKGGDQSSKKIQQQGSGQCYPQQVQQQGSGQYYPQQVQQQGIGQYYPQQVQQQGIGQYYPQQVQQQGIGQYYTQQIQPQQQQGGGQFYSQQFQPQQQQGGGQFYSQQGPNNGVDTQNLTPITNTETVSPTLDEILSMVDYGFETLQEKETRIRGLKFFLHRMQDAEEEVLLQLRQMRKKALDSLQRFLREAMDEWTTLSADLGANLDELLQSDASGKGGSSTPPIVRPPTETINQEMYTELVRRAVILSRSINRELNSDSTLLGQIENTYQNLEDDLTRNKVFSPHFFHYICWAIQRSDDLQRFLACSENEFLRFMVEWETAKDQCDGNNESTVGCLEEQSTRC